jgi:hypothetical protein
MTQVLNDLNFEGVKITKEMVAGLSPYRMSHLNRFGYYSLDSEIANNAMSFKSLFT